MKALVMGLVPRRGMLRSLMGIGLLLSAPLQAWAAEIAGTQTVAQWRRDRSLVPPSVGGLRPMGVSWAYGVLTAEDALGMTCKGTIAVGELDAYMAYRAEPQVTVAEALRAFWQERGCAVPPQGGQPQARASVPMTDELDALWEVRTTTDPGWLRSLIRTEQAFEDAWGGRRPENAATRWSRLRALLARDRLRELPQKEPTQ